MSEHWQDWQTGEPKDLGEVWALRKGAHTARCVLQGHPLGVEAQVLIDNDMQRTQAFRDSADMINVTAEWRAAFELKGWK